MYFGLTEEQRLLRDSVRDVLKKECPPSVVRAAWSTDSAASRAPALWSTLAEMGVLGITAPEVNGGLGMGELELAPILEECGYVALPSPIVETVGVAVPLLRGLGPSDLASDWLKRVSTGGAVLTVGLSRDPFVVDADIADLLILEHAPDFDGLHELHAVTRDDVTLEAQPTVDGARRLFRVTWNPRPATRIAVGDVAQLTAAAAFERGALGNAAVLLGLSRRLIETTVDYVKVRKQFGSAIGSFQAVKHNLSDALMALEFARPVVWRAAHAVALGEDSRSLYVAMAKARASDAATLAARVALQCHGAIGYSFEHDLHLFMKRVWALSAAWGDAAFHRSAVAREILSASSLEIEGAP